MRLPGIQYGQTQKLGRHDIGAPGRTARAMADAAMSVGKAAASWMNAENDSQLQRAKAESQAELHEYTNELMKKDYVPVKDLKRAGVQFNPKDVKMVTNEDGTTSEFVGSQFVMSDLYDAKSRLVHSKYMNGLKYDKGKDQFDIFYTTLNSTSGQAVSTQSFKYRQQALVAEGNETIQTYLAGVNEGNVTETHAQIREVIDRLNASGAVSNSVAQQMTEQAAWSAERGVLNKAVADKDYAGLGRLLARYESATGEDLAAIGITQDQRAEAMSVARNNREKIMSDWQDAADDKMAMQLRDRDFIGARETARNRPGGGPDADLAEYRVNRAIEMDGVYQAIKSDNQGQVDGMIDYLLSDDYINEGGQLSSEEIMSSVAALSRRSNAIENEADAAAVSQQNTNYDQQARRVATDEDIDISEWQAMSDSGDLRESHRESLLAKHRAREDSKIDLDGLMYREGLANKNKDYKATGKDRTTFLEESLRLYLDDENNDTSLGGIVSYFANTMNQLPPSLIRQMENVSSNIHLAGQDDDALASLVQTMQAFKAAHDNNPALLNDSDIGLDPDSYRRLRNIHSRLETGSAVGAEDMMRGEIDQPGGMTQNTGMGESAEAFMSRVKEAASGIIATAQMSPEEKGFTLERHGDELSNEKLAKWLQSRADKDSAMGGSTGGEYFASMVPFVDAPDVEWNAPAINARLGAAFVNEVEAQLLVDGTDLDTAKENAYNHVTSIYALTGAGTERDIIKRPPEKLFSRDGQDVNSALLQRDLSLQAEAALRASGIVAFEDGAEIALEIISDPTSDQRGGYKVWYKLPGDQSNSLLFAEDGSPWRWTPDMDQIETWGNAYAESERAINELKETRNQQANDFAKAAGAATQEREKARSKQEPAWLGTGGGQVPVEDGAGWIKKHREHVEAQRELADQITQKEFELEVQRIADQRGVTFNTIMGEIEAQRKQAEKGGIGLPTGRFN